MTTDDQTWQPPLVEKGFTLLNFFKSELDGGTLAFYHRNHEVRITVFDEKRNVVADVGLPSNLLNLRYR